MKMSYMGKIISVFSIIAILFCSTVSWAVTSGELQKKEQNINNKIEEAQDDLDEVNSNKTEALKAISSITEEINGYQDEIDNLNSQLEELNQSINNSQKEIEEAQKEYDKKEKLLDQRLVTMYEAGNITYLDVLLSSSSLSDLISNYYLVSELASNDTELLNQIEEQKQKIEEQKKRQEENKNKIEIVKKNKETKSKELELTKKEKNQQVTKLSEEEKKIQNTIDQFEKDKRDIKNELAAIAKKNQANIEPSEPSAAGYIFPVQGLSKANIRNKNYPSYPGHTGVDVNINVVGKTIVAVKSGTVVKSLAYKNENGYYSYGECIVIDHHDGTMTLYAHGSPGSRKVTTGQKVSQGQAIMTVGTTGNSSGYHLHFEVRIKGSPVNPLPYLP